MYERKVKMFHAGSAEHLQCEVRELVTDTLMKEVENKC